MRYLSILLLLPLLLAFTPKTVTIGKVYAYKKFLRKGSRGTILNAFKYAGRPSEVVDTTRTLMTGVDWGKIMSTAKVESGYPIKFAGIRMAGEMYMDSRIHYFVYCAPISFIDLTTHTWYHIDASYEPVLRKYYCNADEE